MPIEFSAIPSNFKQPLYWVEIDPSMAGLPTNLQPALIVGQKLSSGKAPVDIPIAIGTLAQAIDAFGSGSMLANMFEMFMKSNFSTLMFGLPVADPVGGVAANGTITVSSPPTQSGTIDLYIAGRHIPINVAASDTVAIVTNNIGAAVNAEPDLPVTATQISGDTGILHLVCKWKGATGNDIDVRDSYLGTLAGEMLPVGLTLTYSGGGKLAG